MYNLVVVVVVVFVAELFSPLLVFVICLHGNENLRTLEVVYLLMTAQ